MEKYLLKEEVDEKQIKSMGLPFKAIKEEGVYWKNIVNEEYVGDDNIIHCRVFVKFDYQPNEGETQTFELDWDTFDILFKREE